MKSYRKELWFNVPARRAFVYITPQVEQYLRESGVAEGLALVNAMHITASVFITTTNLGFIRTTRSGWNNWPRTSRFPSIAITERARTST